MPDITPNDIKDLGFTMEMFTLTEETSFISFIDSIIEEQGDMLQGRIGNTTYSSSTAPMNKYVNRALKCLVAKEMVQRRINIILGKAVGAGQEIDISHEGAQKRAYHDEAESLIQRITAGQTSDTGDFASGVLVTSHYEEENA